MSFFMGLTAAPIGINWGVLGIHDEEKDDRFDARPPYVYRKSSNGFSYDGYGHFTQWPASRGICGDAISYWATADVCTARSGYEVWNGAVGGSARGYFITGKCFDGSNNPLGGATLDLFLTASDLKVNSGTTDSNGVYSIATPYTGQNHYVVANYGPNTLVGASIDTLQPASAPW